MAKVAEVAIGKVFGRLTVTSMYRSVIGSQIHWFCACDCSCGSKVPKVRLSKLGKFTKSCGCFREEMYERGGPAVTHGMSKSKTWNSWRGMVERTTNPSHIGYETYKKFKPDNRWLKFQNFLEDMGPAPEGMTLDRVDTTKSYSRENCRWATLETQNRNKKNNVWLVHKEHGRQILEDVCRMEGTNTGTIWYRVHKAGIPIELALPGWSYEIPPTGFKAIKIGE